jgi:hypothetical protein
MRTPASGRAAGVADPASMLLLEVGLTRGRAR